MSKARFALPHDQRLSREEFASLKEIAKGVKQTAIPDDHKLRLIMMGYARKMTIIEGRVVLALTGAGLKRLVKGDFWLVR